MSRPSVEVAFLTDRGLIRPDNQDYILVDERSLVFCVADGVGGGDGGALASEFLCAEIARAAADSRGFHARLRSCDAAARAAHARIADYAARAGFRRAAGTTMALLALDRETCGPEPGRLTAVAAHIGDSRIYRRRGGSLSLLTRDHTVAEAMRGDGLDGVPADRGGRLGHVLTRAVGAGKWTGPDWRRIDILPGDVFLVCSDGIHDMLSSDSISVALDPAAPASRAADRLAEMVREAGAADNYSIIVVKALL